MKKTGNLDDPSNPNDHLGLLAMADDLEAPPVSEIADDSSHVSVLQEFDDNGNVCPSSPPPPLPRPSKFSQQSKRSVSFGTTQEYVSGPNKMTEPNDSTLQQSSDESADNELHPTSAPKPILRRQSSSRASQRALESFRDSLVRMESMRTSVSSGRRRHQHAAESDLGVIIDARWRPWKSWTLPRIRATALGVLSSSAVLAIRLYLDPTPTVYLIHSIVVFLDMVLIHLFTNSAWLSVGGEVITILSFLAFHFTKETLFELLETTLIAVLCSFHLILSRNKHLDNEQELAVHMRHLRAASLRVLDHLGEIDQQDVVQHLGDEINHRQQNSGTHQDDTSSIETIGESTSRWFGYHHDDEAAKQHLRLCGKHFFEHFLDGSAGVMYTSFLGLIISEVLTYGQSKGY